MVILFITWFVWPPVLYFCYNIFILNVCLFFNLFGNFLSWIQLRPPLSNLTWHEPKISFLSMVTIVCWINFESRWSSLNHFSEIEANSAAQNSKSVLSTICDGRHIFERSQRLHSTPHKNKIDGLCLRKETRIDDFLMCVVISFFSYLTSDWTAINRTKFQTVSCVKRRSGSVTEAMGARVCPSLSPPETLARFKFYSTTDQTITQQDTKPHFG